MMIFFFSCISSDLLIDCTPSGRHELVTDADSRQSLRFSRWPAVAASKRIPSPARVSIFVVLL
jgi:hypothetical protein